jgi:CIC family chloride channel protein
VVRARISIRRLGRLQPDDVAPASERLRNLARRSREVVLLAAVTGVVVGFAVALVDSVAIDVMFESVLDAPLWVQAGAPVVGLVVTAVVLRLAGGVSPATADEYLRSFHEPSHLLTPKPLIARLVGAVATIGSGAPLGLEGPSMYLGAATGSAITRRLPRPLRGIDRRTLLVAGAAAGVSAIFKTPATGAVFALEVPYRDDLARRMLLPALVASASGYLAFVVVHGTEPLFRVTGEPTFNLRDLVGAAAVGVLAGAGARWFASAIALAKRGATATAPRRLAVAAPVLVGLFLATRALTGESLTLGPGFEAVRWAATADEALWLLAAVLVIRCLATATVVGAGGVGGLFVPLVVTGALLGRIVGDAVHTLEPTLFTVIGVAAFLGAGYRVPLAAVMFAAESTGRPGFVVPGLVAAVTAELCVGSRSVTTYQRGGAPMSMGDTIVPPAHRGD